VPLSAHGYLQPSCPDYPAPLASPSPRQAVAQPVGTERPFLSIRPAQAFPNRCVSKRVRGGTPWPVKTVRFIKLLLAGLWLASCSTAQGVSEKLIDSTPSWMGGLPKDVPPRPGTPEYEEFQRKQEAERARDKSHDPRPEHCKNAMATTASLDHFTDHTCTTDYRPGQEDNPPDKR
jgi:hypothetical protein